MPEPVRRGLGTLTARVPHTETAIDGVRLVSHSVHVTVHNGFARTEIEEEFRNDTGRVLEGRYIFPLPPEASVSRLALWVGDTLVEGEVVDKDSAGKIFKQIVEPPPRVVPRDPALLEWVTGGEFSLKIYPMPAHGSRKVVLGYDQLLPVQGGRVEYAYPLSLGADRANAIEHFSLEVIATDSEIIRDPIVVPSASPLTVEGRRLQASYSAQDFVPTSDFRVSYDTGADGQVSVSKYHASAAEPGKQPGAAGDYFAALRIPTDTKELAASSESTSRDRLLVLDVSYSQSKETLAAQTALALAVLSQLKTTEHFAVLACNSKCETFPGTGDASATGSDLEAARSWMAGLSPQGSSDLAGALLRAARIVDARTPAQLVLMGDGQSTSGELSVESIAGRVKPELQTHPLLQVRLIGVGRTIDDVTLGGLARVLGATYQSVASAGSMQDRMQELVRKLSQPVLVAPRLEHSLPGAEVYPAELPSIALGDEIILAVRGNAPIESGVVKLTGSVDGQPVEILKPLAPCPSEAASNPMIPQLWAQHRIAALEAESSKTARQEAIALSRQFHVLSRYTSLLVLENDRMFAEFGILRTTPGAWLQGDSPFSVGTRAKGEEGSMSNPNSRAVQPSAPTPLGMASQGFGSGHGRSTGAHATRPPTIRMGATTVSGRLPPEVIQRIIRQNYGRFRACYVRGLLRNPSLEGRVVARFVIARDGSVATSVNGGSNLPDASVIHCVVSSFRALAFPQPEGGTVTVSYPLMFSSDGSRPAGPYLGPPPPPPPPEVAQGTPAPRRPRYYGPTATHRALDDSWMSDKEAAVEKLRKAVVDDPRSRPRHDALVRGLIAHGRFSEALQAARRFVELDPDLASARLLLAYALSVNGDAKGAVLAIDSLTEGAAHDAQAHERAARGLEAVGDEQRACAHWRSLAELKRTDDIAAFEALRCRARVLGQELEVLGEILALARKTPRLEQLAEQVASGQVPRFEPQPANLPMAASARCSGERQWACPDIILVAPDGSVAAPWVTPSARSPLGTAAMASVRDGAYRVVLVGGALDAKGEVEIRVWQTVGKFPFSSGARVRTIAASTISGVADFPFGGYWDYGGG